MKAKPKKNKGEETDAYAPLKRLSNSKLRKTLEQHKRWLELPSGSMHPGRANLRYTDLKGQQLVGVNLKAADLEGSDLQNAEMQGCNLIDANLDGANLTGADLRKCDFQCANAHRTNLREADLREALLDRAIGLTAGQLAGANLSGAKLPADLNEFDGLKSVELISKSAQKIFLLMLAFVAYSLITIGSVSDSEIFVNSLTSPIPVVGAHVPIVGFLFAAPVILICIFLYFQIHLQRLWEQIAALPAVFPDGRYLDEKVYPWFVTWIAQWCLPRKYRRSKPLALVQALITFFIVWVLVPAAVGVFWVRYYMYSADQAKGNPYALFAVSVAIAAYMLFLANKTLNGQLLRFQVLGPLLSWLVKGIVYSAALVVPLVIAPKSSDFQRANFRGLPYENGDFRHTNLRGANLELSDLKAADLTGANLQQSNLQRADLREATLDSIGADMASFKYALLAEATFRNASLVGADFSSCVLAGVDMSGADLRYAVGLTLSQVNSVILDSGSQLPAYILDSIQTDSLLTVKYGFLFKADSLPTVELLPDTAAP
ncbi:MAG: pentapeptide repeat-containing protein [Candidatus Zixiibacteriota bacterium]